MVTFPLLFASEHKPQSLPGTQTCLCVGNQDWSSRLWPWHTFPFFFFFLELSGPSPFLPVMSWHLIDILSSAALGRSVTFSSYPEVSTLDLDSFLHIRGFHNKSRCQVEPFLGEVVEFLICRIVFPSPLFLCETPEVPLMSPISDFSHLIDFKKSYPFTTWHVKHFKIYN